MSEENSELLAGKYKTPEDLERGYKELEGALGRRSPLPAPDAGPDAWDEALGKLVSSGPDDWKQAHLTPKEAKDYGLKVPEGLEDDAKAFMDELHAVGAPVGVAQKAWERELDRYKEKLTKVEEQKAAKMDALEKAFGNALDRVKMEANAALDAFGDDEAREFLNEHGDNPAILRMMAKFGQTLGEDRVNYTAAQSGRLTPAEIEDRLADKMARKLELATKAFNGNLPELESKELQKLTGDIMKLREQLPGGSDPASELLSASSR